MRRKRNMGMVMVGFLVITFSLGSVNTVQGQETINVMFEAGVPKTEAVLERLDEFTAETGIKVNPILAPGEKIKDRILADHMAPGPSLYDVSMIWVEVYMPLLASIGYLEPLDEYFTSQQIKDIYPATIKVHSYKGTLYGWPWYDHTVGNLFYRTDLFKQYGIATPPTTWDEYVKIAKKLTLDLNGDGEVDVYGVLEEGLNHPEPIARAISRIMQAGGSVSNEEGTRATLNSKEAIEGLQFQIDVLAAGISPPGSLGMHCVDGHTLFGHGRLAMFENWPYMFALANNPEYSQVVGKFWVTPSVGKVKRTWWLGSFGWVIPSKSEHKKAAVKFLKWVASDRMLINAALAESVPPNRVSLLHVPEFKDHPQFEPIAKAISMAVPPPSTRTPHWPKISDIFATYWQNALLGKMSAKEAWEKATDEINRLLKEKGQ